MPQSGRQSDRLWYTIHNTPLSSMYRHIAIQAVWSNPYIALHSLSLSSFVLILILYNKMREVYFV